jgi:hypothetical protein
VVLQVLSKLAEQYNRRPLPELRQRHGLRLPPEADCLTAPNYQIEGAVAPPTAAQALGRQQQQQAVAVGGAAMRQQQRQDGPQAAAVAAGPKPMEGVQ